MDTIEFDLSRDALYVMKNEKNQIIAAISIDLDEAVENLTCWSPALAPGAELARLCVHAEYHNRCISRAMMQHAFDVLRTQGIRSVHILVKTGHTVALHAYETLGFRRVGECFLFEKDYVCMELAL